MVTSLPTILGYSLENIRGKIAGLHKLDFADPVKMITSFPPILGYSIGNIRDKLADLRELGFADPVKVVMAKPAILGHSRERVLLCGRIIMRLEERTGNMLGRLIKESRAVIDAVAVAQPRTWADVYAIIIVAKKGAAKTPKG
jgi:mTERF protein